MTLPARAVADCAAPEESPPVVDALLEHPFDHYQRFRPVREILDAYRRRVDRARLTVLDIGGAAGDLRPFLPQDRILTVDVRAASRPDVVAQGEALPVRGSCVDVVTCIDTIEHVVAASRLALLREALRVSSDLVILAAPFDDADVRAAEAYVEACHQKLYGRSDDWLLEHAACGLPALAPVSRALEAARATLRIVPNGYLPYWRFTMALNYLLLLLPESHLLYRRINRLVNSRYYDGTHREPCYRRILVACHGDAEWLDDCIARTTGHAARDRRDELEAEALGLLGTCLAGSMAERIAFARGLEDHVHHLEDHVHHLEDHVREVQAALASAESHAAHLAREHRALSEEHARTVAHREELENYARHVEDEFAKAGKLIEAWGVERELQRKHGEELEGERDRLRIEARSKDEAIAMLRRSILSRLLARLFPARRPA